MALIDELPSTDQSVAEFREATMEPDLIDVLIPDDVTPPPINELECDVCGRSDFKGIGGLRRHRTRVHHMEPEGDKPPKSTSIVGSNQRKAQSVKKIEDQTSHWLGMIQIGLMASGDQYCAAAIGEEGPPIARSIAEVAQDFPLIKKVVESTDKWGALAVLTYHSMRLGLIIGVHHNAVPYTGIVRFMVPPPPPKVEKVNADATNGNPAAYSVG